jgi:hypothetical protein
MAAANEKPATTEFSDWDWISCEITWTVSKAVVDILLYSQKIIPVTNQPLLKSFGTSV